MGMARSDSASTTAAATHTRPTGASALSPTAATLRFATTAGGTSGTSTSSARATTGVTACITITIAWGETLHVFAIHVQNNGLAIKRLQL